MPYATQADLEARYGVDELVKLTDRAEPPAGVADGETVARALADASNLIDGYLAGRYTLPLSAVPALVATWCAQIARYLLHVHGAPERVEADYRDAIAQLRDVAAGKLTLQAAGIEPAGADPAGGVRSHAAPRVFDRDILRGYTG